MPKVATLKINAPPPPPPHHTHIHITVMISKVSNLTCFKEDNVLFSARCAIKDRAPEPCGRGFYASEGSISCGECPVGFFCPLLTTASPQPCTSGFYANETKSVSCVECDRGKLFLLLITPTHPPIHPPTYSPTKLPSYLPAYLPTYLPTFLFTHPPTYLPTYNYFCLYLISRKLVRGTTKLLEQVV